MWNETKNIHENQYVNKNNNKKLKVCLFSLLYFLILNNFFFFSFFFHFHWQSSQSYDKKKNYSFKSDTFNNFVFLFILKITTTTNEIYKNQIKIIADLLLGFWFDIEPLIQFHIIIKEEKQKIETTFSVWAFNILL